MDDAHVPALPSRPWLIATAIGAFAAVVAYVGTTVVGGAIVPGYSHLEDSVSSLTSPGAPFRLGLGVGYGLYNAAVVLLGIGVLRTSQPSWRVRLGSGLLVAGAVAGVLMVDPFPQDPMGAPITPTGIVHIVLAGLSALGLVAAAVLYGAAWRTDPRWHAIWWVSIAAAGAILVTGGVGAAFVTSPVFGLLERFTQVSFLTWFAVIGVTATRALRRAS